ncbi:MAG TPA: AraC family transcriptional regulator [Anseongella sp.]|nr:AraC family transcriptional regulator [Anseongella sp.]
MQNYHKYLSVSEEDKKWGLYLVTAGQGTFEKGTGYPASDHPGEYLFNWNKGRILNGLYIVYIARGKGTFESENTPPCPIGEGTCFMLFPKVWHRYHPDPEYGWQEYWLGFQGRVMQEWMQRKCLPDRDVFYEVGQNNHLISLFLKILNYVKSNPAGLQQIVTGIAMEILGIVLGTERNNAPVTLDQKIEWAKLFISENLEKRLYGPELAAELAMSYSLFRKTFKSLAGVSPGQYHLQKRVEKAQELLSTTLLSVEEIATFMGFESVYYFSRIFRIKSGISPTAYRKQFFLR